MNDVARSLAVLAFAAALGGHASAALDVGDTAPDFEAPAALGGSTFRFSLSEALRKGPVVLYFYPKAFTSGCTIEARNFAEASDRFSALGATVIGMSNDDIDTLKKFSVEACRNKFAVAADADASVMKRYDAAQRLAPSTAARISYVISPQGRVAFVYDSSSPDGHVERTLEAVQRMKAGGRP
jgi:peroxiredoxin